MGTLKIITQVCFAAGAAGIGIGGALLGETLRDTAVEQTNEFDIARHALSEQVSPMTARIVGGLAAESVVLIALTASLAAETRRQKS